MLIPPPSPSPTILSSVPLTHSVQSREQSREQNIIRSYFGSKSQDMFTMLILILVSLNLLHAYRLTKSQLAHFHTARVMPYLDIDYDDSTTIHDID